MWKLRKRIPFFDARDRPVVIRINRIPHLRGVRQRQIAFQKCNTFVAHPVAQL